MKRPVIWSTHARSELLAIIGYIADDSPAAAAGALERLERTAEALGDTPTGRPGRVTGTYEKSVTGLPYVIAYEVSIQPAKGERIDVLHIIHTARDWQAGGRPQA